MQLYDAFRMIPAQAAWIRQTNEILFAKLQYFSTLPRYNLTIIWNDFNVARVPFAHS